MPGAICAITCAGARPRPPAARGGPRLAAFIHVPPVARSGAAPAPAKAPFDAGRSGAGGQRTSARHRRGSTALTSRGRKMRAHGSEPPPSPRSARPAPPRSPRRRAPRRCRNFGLDAAQFGVRPGAASDQSGALQRAIDQAAQTRVPLMLAPGVYRAGDLKLPAGARLSGVRGATRLILTQGPSLLVGRACRHRDAHRPRARRRQAIVPQKAAASFISIDVKAPAHHRLRNRRRRRQRHHAARAATAK